MLQAGFARREITPSAGVELTGWGYYLNRTWQTIHDHLYATAAVFRSNDVTVVVVAIDLMLIDVRFTQLVRRQLRERLQIPPECVLITCSHTHNAPAAGGLRGVGECDPRYEDWAAEQIVLTVTAAAAQLQPARLRCGSQLLPGLSFNRTRDPGVVDDCLTAAAVEDADGNVLGVLCSFAAHPTVMTEMRPFAVSRDVPGQVCDRLEQRYPGALAMYLQGACGDTNFLREFQTEERCHLPAERLDEAVAQILEQAQPDPDQGVAASTQIVSLSTRRWTADEVWTVRNEAERRLLEHDLTGWRESLGRSMTNRPDDMVARHGGDEWKAVAAMCRFHLEWTDEILPDLQTRAEVLDSEVQAIRVGQLGFVANSAEFFSPFALQVRAASPFRELMIACYSNGRIGYLPDEHDLQARSYAGLQSPRYCGQFPFTADSGPEMCRGMLAVLEQCARE